MRSWPPVLYLLRAEIYAKEAFSKLNQHLEMGGTYVFFLAIGVGTSVEHHPDLPMPAQLDDTSPTTFTHPSLSRRRRLSSGVWLQDAEIEDGASSDDVCKIGIEVRELVPREKNSWFEFNEILVYTSY